MNILQANPWIQEHIALYRSNPERAHLWDARISGGPGPTPSLLLTSTGRKTGTPRPSPLIYQQVNDSYVVLASKGGMDDHPIWYLNLQANPHCHLQISTTSLDALARTAEGDERATLWGTMINFYPLYAEYQSRTSRLIPIVVFDPWIEP